MRENNRTAKAAKKSQWNRQGRQGRQEKQEQELNRQDAKTPAGIRAIQPPRRQDAISNKGNPTAKAAKNAKKTEIEVEPPRRGEQQESNQIELCIGSLIPHSSLIIHHCSSEPPRRREIQE